MQAFNTDGTVRDDDKFARTFAGIAYIFFATEQAPNGAYQIFCNLGPKGQIVQYSISEPGT